MFLSKLHQIKAFILDIDGVLTDGTVLVTETGEQLRRFNIRDGYALQLAVKLGFKICVISGGKSQSVILRLTGLGITDVYLGVENKLEVYHSFLERHQLIPDEVVYMGDDIPDVTVMKIVGVPVCPADAAEEVKAVSLYISPKKGGEGCVRDIVEKVLKVQKIWYNADDSVQDDIVSA